MAGSGRKVDNCEEKGTIDQNAFRPFQGIR